MLTLQVVLCVARHSDFALVRPVCPCCALKPFPENLGTKFRQLSHDQHPVLPDPSFTDC